MTLVDDYLRAVALLLPKDQREDITAELRDTILNRIEERQAALGRPLTDDEVEAVLREVGHPLVVAARYREGAQSLIGPALYPFWLFAVKAAVTLQLCLSALIFLVRIVGGAEFGRAFGQAFASGFSGVISLIGFITLGAWLIERQGVKVDYLDRWRVKDLRVLELASWDWRDWRTHLGGDDPAAWRDGAAAPGAAGAWPESRPASPFDRRPDWAQRRAWQRWRRREQSQASRALGIIVAASVAALWWTGVLRFGFSAAPDAWRAVVIEPGALAGVDWAAAKAEAFWPVLAYLAGNMAWGFSILARPFATRVHGAFDLLLGAALLAGIAWTAVASPLAPAVDGRSLGALALRLRDAMEGGPPFPLADCIVGALAIAGLIGVSRLLRGLWLTVEAAPVAARPA
jgi:hypothetical protein